MSLHPLAGKQAPRELLENIPRLVAAYYANKPDVKEIDQKISFGTSGHRGSSINYAFNENHILAISQAICDYRKQNNIDGPLYIGKDTHALSEPAFMSAIEVFAANGINVFYQEGFGYTPTPVVSHAILVYNKGKNTGLADGVIITPSHNPPNDGGIKYNPPTGGPADSDSTKIIQDRANDILANNLLDVKRIAFDKAIKNKNVEAYDYIVPYVQDLKSIIEMELIANSGLKIGVDPMGGAGINFWESIADTYKIDIEKVNNVVDPTFSFMTLDRDGKIRMDCSSPYAMAGLIQLKNKYNIAFGNDPDYDRHGIVTKSAGLMNPNHYLSVAIWYLFQNRPMWKQQTAVGKTLVSSSMIDRVVQSIGKKLSEVPVGFKWFVDGLIDGSYGFGGEESAGASFLRKDGSVWTTDKDGIIMNLLAAEIMVKTQRDPSQIYAELEQQHGSAVYERSDAPATLEQKEKLKSLNPEDIQTLELAGERILAKLSHAPGNNAAIGGLKVVTKNGWFAARPSGTENVYKIYAESFLGENHLKRIQEEARKIVLSVV